MITQQNADALCMPSRRKPFSAGLCPPRGATVGKDERARGAHALAANVPPKPNFIVINIDDPGYADIGPFESKFNRTPHLDRMAAEGRKFTSFYAAPVCSPSRAALMTGSYAKRALPIQGDALPGQFHRSFPFRNHRRGGPQVRRLRDSHRRQVAPPRPSRVSPQNGQVVKRVLPDDQQSLAELYTDETLAYTAAHRSAPFFLHLAHNAVHFPLYPEKNGSVNLRTASTRTGSRRSMPASAAFSTRCAPRVSLGLDGPAPGSRPIGRVENPHLLIEFDQ